MKAYRYNPDTNIYEGEQDRQLDPIATQHEGKDVYLMPANCTDIEMTLEAKDGYDIIFNNSAWEYKEQEKQEEPTESTEAPELTTEQKITQLDSQYASDKQTLQGYYIAFMIDGDTDGMESIKEELEALATQYDTDLTALEAEEDE